MRGGMIWGWAVAAAALWGCGAESASSGASPDAGTESPDEVRTNGGSGSSSQPPPGNCAKRCKVDADKDGVAGVTTACVAAGVACPAREGDCNDGDAKVQKRCDTDADGDGVAGQGQSCVADSAVCPTRQGDCNDQDRNAQKLCPADADADGWIAAQGTRCVSSATTCGTQRDCDDTNPAAQQSCPLDADGDGFYDPNGGTACVSAATACPESADCDDGDGAIGAGECPLRITTISIDGVTDGPVRDDAEDVQVPVLLHVDGRLPAGAIAEVREESTDETRRIAVRPCDQRCVAAGGTAGEGGIIADSVWVRAGTTVNAHTYTVAGLDGEQHRGRVVAMHGPAAEAGAPRNALSAAVLPTGVARMQEKLRAGIARAVLGSGATSVARGLEVAITALDDEWRDDPAQGAVDGRYQFVVHFDELGLSAGTLDLRIDDIDLVLRVGIKIPTPGQEGPGDGQPATWSHANLGAFETSYYPSPDGRGEVRVRQHADVDCNTGEPGDETCEPLVDWVAEPGDLAVAIEAIELHIGGEIPRDQLWMADKVRAYVRGTPDAINEVAESYIESAIFQAAWGLADDTFLARLRTSDYLQDRLVLSPFEELLDFARSIEWFFSCLDLNCCNSPWGETCSVPDISDVNVDQMIYEALDSAMTSAWRTLNGEETGRGLDIDRFIDVRHMLEFVVNEQLHNGVENDTCVGGDPTRGECTFEGGRTCCNHDEDPEPEYCASTCGYVGVTYDPELDIREGTYCCNYDATGTWDCCEDIVAQGSIGPLPAPAECGLGPVTFELPADCEPTFGADFRLATTAPILFGDTGLNLRVATAGFPDTGALSLVFESVLDPVSVNRRFSDRYLAGRAAGPVSVEGYPSVPAAASVGEGLFNQLFYALARGGMLEGGANGVSFTLGAAPFVTVDADSATQNLVIDLRNAQIDVDQPEQKLSVFADVRVRLELLMLEQTEVDLIEAHPSLPASGRAVGAHVRVSVAGDTAFVLRSGRTPPPGLDRILNTAVETALRKALHDAACAQPQADAQSGLVFIPSPTVYPGDLEAFCADDETIDTYVLLVTQAAEPAANEAAPPRQVLLALPQAVVGPQLDVAVFEAQASHLVVSPAVFDVTLPEQPAPGETLDEVALTARLVQAMAATDSPAGLTWESSAPEIAAVDASGHVTVVGQVRNQPTTVYVTARYDAGASSLAASAQIVLAAEPTEDPTAVGCQTAYCVDPTLPEDLPPVP